jgi:hypothetical protein
MEKAAQIRRLILSASSDCRHHGTRSIELSGTKRGFAAVKDYKASIEKLRKDAAEAKLISDLATDMNKREMFARLHQHLSKLADEVEQAMKSSIAP